MWRRITLAYALALVTAGVGVFALRFLALDMPDVFLDAEVTRHAPKLLLLLGALIGTVAGLVSGTVFLRLLGPAALRHALFYSVGLLVLAILPALLVLVLGEGAAGSFTFYLVVNLVPVAAECGSLLLLVLVLKAA